MMGTKKQQVQSLKKVGAVHLRATQHNTTQHMRSGWNVLAVLASLCFPLKLLAFLLLHVI